MTEYTITTSANGAGSVYAIDMDGDGDTDVLSASIYDDTVAWYENLDGSGGSFSTHVITTSADGARSVFAIDMDGDDDVDVLSASINDDTIAWYVHTNAQTHSLAHHKHHPDTSGMMRYRSQAPHRLHSLRRRLHSLRRTLVAQTLTTMTEQTSTTMTETILLCLSGSVWELL